MCIRDSRYPNDGELATGKAVADTGKEGVDEMDCIFDRANRCVHDDLTGFLT